MISEQKQLRGFTIIEAALAVVLLGAGVFGILFAFQSSVQSSLMADQTIVATNLARETLSRVIAQRDCNEIGCGYAATLISIAAGIYDDASVSGFSGYSIDTTVLEVDPDDDNAVDDFLDAQIGSNYARVTVAVTYNGGTISLATLLVNY